MHQRGRGKGERKKSHPQGFTCLVKRTACVFPLLASQCFRQAILRKYAWTDPNLQSIREVLCKIYRRGMIHRAFHTSKERMAI